MIDLNLIERGADYSDLKKSYVIFLCASGDADDVSSDMKDFLDWLSGKQGRSRLVGKLENAVQKVKDHKEWRTEYMTPEEFKEAMEKPVSV